MGGISEACFFQGSTCVPHVVRSQWGKHRNASHSFLNVLSCWFPSPRSSLLREISHRSPDEGLDAAYREQFHDNGNICLVAFTKRHSPLRVVQFFQIWVNLLHKCKRSTVETAIHSYSGTQALCSDILIRHYSDGVAEISSLVDGVRPFKQT